jgi:F-type H+-transporting ATPase subunit gamma
LVWLSKKKNIWKIGGIREYPGNLKEVRNRMKSVVSIQKITKTMKMIASSRLRAAEKKVDQTKPFYASQQDILRDEPESNEISDKIKEAKKWIVIPICTDKGLCGAINSQVIKAVKSFVHEKEKEGKSISIISLGDKAISQLSRELGPKVLYSYGDISKKPLTFTAISIIIDKIMQLDFDCVALFYNHYKNIISYILTQHDILNLKTENNPIKFDNFEFEDDQLSQMSDLFEFHFGSALFNSYIENQASELGARMSSMDNATRNAGEMLKRLTISYNRRRQAAITTELTEIISGASALKS